MVHVCLAVTCHLYFWLNDQYLLHATAVTQCGTDTECTRIQCLLTQTERIYHHAYNNPLGIPLLSTAEENPARIPMNYLLQSPDQDLPSGSMYLHGVRAVWSTWFFPFHSSSRRTACHWSGMQDEEWNPNTAVRPSAVFVTVCSKQNYNRFNNSTCATPVRVGKLNSFKKTKTFVLVDYLWKTNFHSGYKKDCASLFVFVHAVLTNSVWKKRMIRS